MKKVKVLLLVLSSKHMPPNIYRNIGWNYINSIIKKHGNGVKTICESFNKFNIESVVKSNPDIVALNELITNPDIIKLTEDIKKQLPSVLVGIGGGYPTVDPLKKLQECSNVDFIIHGDGEIVWPNLIDNLESGVGFKNVKGVIYRDGSEIIENERATIEHLEEYPYPNQSMEPKRQATITTSRGCIGNCSFCDNRVVSPKWIGRDIDKVIEEIKLYRSQGKYDIQFADKSMESDFSCKRLMKLAEGIRGLGVVYGGNFRPDFCRKATPEIMNTLQGSGLYKTLIGAEAGNDEDLQLYNKKTTAAEAGLTIEIFKHYDVAVYVGFIMHNPYSTFDRLRVNLAFLKEHNLVDLSYLITALFLIPGTQLHKKVMADGLIKEPKKPYETEYNFVDSRIQFMVELINLHMKTLNQNDLEEYKGIFDKSIAYIKSRKRISVWRNFNNESAMKRELDILWSGEAQINEVLDKEREKIARWYSILLDQFESFTMDPKKIIQLSRNFINNTELRKLVKKVKRIEDTTYNAIDNGISA